MSTFEFHVAQKANVLHFVQQPKPHFCKAAGTDAFAAAIGMHINTLQVRHIVSPGNDVRLEDQFAVFEHHVDAILLDPSRDPFQKAFTVANHRVHPALEQGNLGRKSGKGFYEYS